MAEYKLPDPKKNAGRVLGIGLLAALGLVAYAYILPFLLTVVWGTVELAIACAVAGVLLYVLLSPKFWKRLGIILETLGEILFRGFVEMNPFTILSMQLDKMDEDRAELFKQIGKLRAQQNKLQTQLINEEEAMKLAAAKMEECKFKLSKNPNDEETGYLLESAANDFNNSKDYIDKVAPIEGDISKLVTFAAKAHTKSGYALKNARSTVQKQKDTYEAVTAGSNAMRKALRAFTGDPEMNKAGAIALEKLRTDIAEKVGIIKNCIQETSKFMNERDLEDAAKVRLAAQNIEQLKIDQTFKYGDTVADKGAIPESVKQGNKWLDSLKK